jgi:hypothetical protein
MSTKTIMNAKQTTGAGTGYPLNNIYTKENKTFQISVAGSGAVTATVAIEVSNDNVTYISDAYSTVSLSGTTSAAQGLVMEANWQYVRANVTAISGTSAAVTVILGTM